MKAKIAFQTLALFFVLGLRSNAQDKEKAMNEPSVTWYGIDYTLARFTSIAEDPELFVKQYFNAINRLVPDEPEKYDLGKYFDKEETAINLDQVTARNAAIDPATLLISEPYEIGPEDVQALIGSYDTSGQSGMGLIFVAENLNKEAETGSYYVCFFDTGTKNIVDARRITGKAAGFGVRNYWAGSVYNVMKAWLREK